MWVGDKSQKKNVHSTNNSRESNQEEFYSIRAIVSIIRTITFIHHHSVWKSPKMSHFDFFHFTNIIFISVRKKIQVSCQNWKMLIFGAKIQKNVTRRFWLIFKHCALFQVSIITNVTGQETWIGLNFIVNCVRINLVNYWINWGPRWITRIKDWIRQSRKRRSNAQVWNGRIFFAHLTKMRTLRIFWRSGSKIAWELSMYWDTFKLSLLSHVSTICKSRKDLSSASK